MGAVTRFLATKLVKKRIVRVIGQDSLPYLQTIMTNDIRHVAPGSGNHCVYSYITNAMGRSLADVFVYQPVFTTNDRSVQRNLVLAPFYSDDFGQGGLETDQALIECDANIAGGLARTLFAMKIRRKVEIEEVDSKNVWVIHPENPSQTSCIFPLSNLISDDLILVQDPRLFNFAYRLIVPSNWDLRKINQVLGDNMELSQSKVWEYELYRYKLGIGEGDKEQPEGQVFPLECNADLLNGISFKKGLFSGDWITGRNYRKGAVARIVPFELEQCSRTDLDLVAPDTVLLDTEHDKEIGVIRANRGRSGLASVVTSYVKHGMETTFRHSSSNVCGKCWIPSWWPEYIERVNEGIVPDGKLNPYFIPDLQR